MYKVIAAGAAVVGVLIVALTGHLWVVVPVVAAIAIATAADRMANKQPPGADKGGEG